MMETAHFTSPPPVMGGRPPMGGPPNMSLPPPNMSVPPPNMPGHPGHHFNRYGGGGPPAGIPQQGPRGPQQFFQPFRPYPRPTLDPEFDGKRLRKSVMRKTVDYNAAIIKMLEARVWQRDFRDRRALQPDVLYYPDLQPPRSYEDNPMNAVTTRFVKTATNKMRCPVFCMAWTPEGRRLVTGASSGEFTLWNGLTFNFETILQAHDSPVRTMVWSHNEQWMVTADHAGYVKYWQSNMNNVKMFQGHKEAVRGISFSPSDSKFATCSDDGTIRVWDFLRCHEERILRGHGADVKCVDWHPQKGLIVSGSKDNQQPVKLWDPKSGQSLATLHAHKSTVMDVKWNSNGNWLVTASRDHLLKLFDIRQLGQELQTFRGHKKESSSVAWHPYHEGLFASGGSDGAILFWHVGADKEVGAIEQAHDSIVWTLAWHPLGHILCSGSNDHTSKFWTRNRPGDQMRDKYNLNTMPAGVGGLEEMEHDDSSVIPGMGPEDKVDGSLDPPDLSVSTSSMEGAAIPGLDFDMDDKNCKLPLIKKVPYSKPIPRNFQAQWNDTARPNIDEENGDDDLNGEHREADQDAIAKMIQQIVEKVPGVVPVTELEPTALFMYGKVLPVTPDSVLARTISNGADAIYRLINCGAVEDLVNDIAHDEQTQYYHDDPAVDNELRSLKAYELPRRPPLLSTPNIPPQKLPERARGRGRGRDNDRGRSRDREGDDEDYRDGQDYNEDDYYEDYEEDDSDAVHQRFMSEEEEIYNSTLQDHDSGHAYGDQDMRMLAREFVEQAGNGDQDMRQQAAPGPSLLGIAPGIPGVLGRSPGPGAAPAGPAPFMKDLDMRRSGSMLPDRDPRQKHGAGAGPGAGAAASSAGDEDIGGGDRDFRRSSRPPLLPQGMGLPGQGGLLGKFPNQAGFSVPAPKDLDYRQQAKQAAGAGDGPVRGAQSSAHYRGKDDYEDGEDMDDQDDESSTSYGRSGPSPGRAGGGYGGRWGPNGSQGGAEGEEDYDDSGAGPSPGRWGPRGRGRGHRGGGGGGWDNMRGGGGGAGRAPGLLETPKGGKGGLLATPNMPPMPHEMQAGDDDYHGGKRRRWDDEAHGEGHEDGEDAEGGGHRGGYRGRGGRGGWGGGGGGYSSSSRGSWSGPGSGGGGPMGRGRGRGRPGGPPRSRGRGRGRN